MVRRFGEGKGRDWRGSFLGSRLDIVFDPETRGEEVEEEGQEVDDIPGFGFSGRNALFGSWAQTRLVFEGGGGGKGIGLGQGERDREEEGREVSWGIGVCSGGRSLG
jgi:hypothetical protein